jgi:hypothetical protein
LWKFHRGVSNGRSTAAQRKKRCEEGSLDARFGRHGKGDAELPMGRVVDVGFAARFLAAKVVRRYADHHEAAFAVSPAFRLLKENA